MSLVNLSHVCSHLQNASLARLGLTSIPYTRLHLSLALLLQKQGFFSYVKLAGPSPPASCFPPGMRDSHSGMTSHPHAERGVFTNESALQRMVRGAGVEELREEGFGEEEVEWAVEKTEKTSEQLVRDGCDRLALQFLLKHEGKGREQLRAQGLPEADIAIVEQHAAHLAEIRSDIERWHAPPRSESVEGEDLNSALTDFTSFLNAKFEAEVLRRGFDKATLLHFAPPSSRYITERDLHLSGYTSNIMGLDIPNQPYSPPPPPSAQDPWDIETEGVVTQANRASRRLWLGMKYWDGHPVLKKARMLSKPTKRIWCSEQELGLLTRGRQAGPGGEVQPLSRVGEVMIVQTKKKGDGALMEVREAVERRLGGMVLCRVW